MVQALPPEASTATPKSAQDSSTADPTASVVLCVRNGGSLLRRQLDALAEQSAEGWELIVVDNGSTDGSGQLAGSFIDRIPRLRVIGAHQRAGLSYARNVGAAVARGKVLAFCDADDVVSAGWLEALVRCIQTADLVCGRLRLTELNSTRAQYWRAMPDADCTFPTALGYRPYAVGANFAIRREVYLAVGGCDEDFVTCSDDVDLSWRVQAAGYSIEPCHDAVVDYQLRESMRTMARQKFNYGYAEAMLLRKHREVPRARFVERWPVYWYLVSRSFHLFSDTGRRGRWVSFAAYAAGRVRGGFRYRVFHF